jgi:hypothetical protein
LKLREEREGADRKISVGAFQMKTDEDDKNGNWRGRPDYIHG